MRRPFTSIGFRYRSVLVASCAFAILGCQSSVSTTNSSSSKPVAVDTTKTPVVQDYGPYKFVMYFSGSGGVNGKPQDSFRMDTLGMMAVKTSSKDTKGNWHTVSAFAQLEENDRDTLVTMIKQGKLDAIDSLDVTSICAGDEIYILDILPTPEFGSQTTHLQFHACAADYNLLIGAQRTNFRKLVDWFERMRIKYRPVQP